MIVCAVSNIDLSYYLIFNKAGKIDKLEYILHKLKDKQHECINGDGVVGCTRVLLGS
jgi:hypothetical protein